MSELTQIELLWVYKYGTNHKVNYSTSLQGKSVISVSLLISLSCRTELSHLLCDNSGRTTTVTSKLKLGDTSK